MLVTYLNRLFLKKAHLLVLFLSFFLFFFLMACTNSETSEAAIEKEKLAATTSKKIQVEAETKPVLVTHPIALDTSIQLDYIMGKFKPTKDQRFVQIAPKYANGRKDRYLRKAAYDAFLKMYEAAKKEGIELKIISATRNFATQKIIWEGKWTGKRLQEGKENLAKTTPDPVERATKILKWSSMPGTSRHHWGTDIDLNALNNAYFEKGKGLKIYKWLTANASSFGYCQPYSPKDAIRPNGYNEEKWHWSYLPLAKPLTDQAKLRLKNEMITGFKGAETAVEMQVVDHFILGINEACL